MGILDIIGLVYLKVRWKRILRVYKISGDGMVLDAEKGEMQRLLGERRGKLGVRVEAEVDEMLGWGRDRVVDLY